MRTIGAVRSAEIVALGSASMNSFALILPLTWPASSAEPHSMRLNEASAVFAMPTWEDVFIVPSNLPSIKMLDEDKRSPLAFIFLLSTVENRSGFLVVFLLVINNTAPVWFANEKAFRNHEPDILKAFRLPFTVDVLAFIWELLKLPCPMRLF